MNDEKIMGEFQNKCMFNGEYCCFTLILNGLKMGKAFKSKT